MGSSTKGAKSIWRLRCVGSDLHSLPAERLRRAVLWRKCCGRCSSPRGAYPVLDEPTLSSRWNLPPKTLQRWRSEGIGPPAWHLAQQIRYLLAEIETFERKAQVTWRPKDGSALSESSPTAREDAIRQMTERRLGRRDMVLFDVKETTEISGIPGHWLLQEACRRRLGIPFYVLGDGSVIRFSIEELFRWEVHHLRGCRRAEADLGAARQRRTSS